MIKEDFTQIKYITQKEIEATGSDIRAVAKRTIVALDKLRDMVGKPVILQKNGLTTGSHRAIEHAQGLAIDCYFKGVTSWENIQTIALMAISIGFTGLGIYWNGNMFSFHFDLGPRRCWTGIKTKKDREWSYRKLLLNPKEDA